MPGALQSHCWEQLAPHRPAPHRTHSPLMWWQNSPTGAKLIKKYNFSQNRAPVSLIWSSIHSIHDQCPPCAIASSPALVPPGAGVAVPGAGGPRVARGAGAAAILQPAQPPRPAGAVLAAVRTPPAVNLTSNPQLQHSTSKPTLHCTYSLHLHLFHTFTCLAGSLVPRSPGRPSPGSRCSCRGRCRCRGSRLAGRTADTPRPSPAHSTQPSREVFYPESWPAW